MLLLLRRLKHDLFMNDHFRRYLAYAFGELLLVVLGILIALQIDNWNEDRKEQAMLRSYLESIARNMREDLAELEPLRDFRRESLYLASRFDALRDRKQLSVDEIFFFSRLWSAASSTVFFGADTSGFEALKSSGVLNRLQGSGLERLLSRYYDHVSQVRLLETAMQDEVGPLLTELRQSQPPDLEPWAIMNPSSLSPQRFQAVQPLYAEFINSPTAAAMVDSQFRHQLLLLHYDSLAVFGSAFIAAVDSGRLDAPGTLPRALLDDFRDGLGPAEFLLDGHPQSQNYWVTTASGPDNAIFDFSSIRLEDGAMRVDYPGGTEWAVVYWGLLAPNELGGRGHQDYSRFGKLHLELKGGRGGELIRAHVKDADYPDDVSPVSVDLVLTDDWQTFEIDLAEFAPNDISRLHVPLGLLIFPADEPLSFSIRNAYFR